LGHLSAVGCRIVEARYLDMGLHDRPDVLRARLQAEIDQVSVRDDLDAVVLVYGLCGCGTAGLAARRYPLVIPRAHDCVTLFLGSKEAYVERQRLCPSGF